MTLNSGMECLLQPMNAQKDKSQNLAFVTVKFMTLVIAALVFGMRMLVGHFIMGLKIGEGILQAAPIIVFDFRIIVL